MTKTGSAPGRRIYRANQSFTCEFNGGPVIFTPFVTVREGHPVMKNHEHLFEELVPDYEVASVDFEVPEKVEPKVERVVEKPEKPEYETATAAPGEIRGKK